MTVTLTETDHEARNSRGKKKDKDKNEEKQKRIIRVFSLNVWGIPFGISRNKRERLEAIIQYLIANPYDYVFFQEVWTKEDFQFLQNWLKSVLPYSHYFESGFVGSGTCIFSCTPFKEIQFYPFNLCGYPHKILHGDWFAGKGLGMCETEFDGIPILLINSHLHAAYNGDAYVAHRLCQAFEASLWLNQTTINHHLAIFGTDFNSDPVDVPYQFFIQSSGFKDSFVTCEKEPPRGTDITSGNPQNSYSTPNSEKRIDYVFYRHIEDCEVKVLVHDHPLPARVPYQDFSYSDHEALRTVISIEPTLLVGLDGSSDNDNRCKIYGKNETFLEAYNICDEGLRNALRNQVKWFKITLGVIVLTVLACVFICYIDGEIIENILLFKNILAPIWILGFLLLLFCSYISLSLTTRECCSLRRVKNSIFHKVFEVACQNSQGNARLSHAKP